MARPYVVIVGRTNVGKSTLFNRMVGSSVAIVEDVPDVTRDRNYMEAVWEDKAFIAVDTGGFYTEPSEDISKQMKEQAAFAIEEADVIIHLLDGKEGLTPADIELSKTLRASGKKILWVVNKIDTPKREDRLYDFYALGADELLPVSAATGYEFGELMDRIASLLPQLSKEESAYPRIAVVGRPNVGKSTLVNALLGKKRMIVSPLPGTTRDAVDSVCSYYKNKYLIIDTAGIRKKGKLGFSIERFSAVRAIRSIERCDIALIVLDASDGITEQDQKIAGIVESCAKGAIFLLNKWDIVREPETAYKKIIAELQRKMWFLNHAPAISVSGMEKKRITKIFPVIDEIIAERKKRIPTPEINRFIKEVTSGVPLSLYKGRQVRIPYMTQIGTEPPAFVIFSNYPAGIKESYVRYIEKCLRERFSFKGTPIRIFKKLKA
ncbi:MAG: ribosome biogenesis GTPase Der [Thermodesulfovibrionales bacterium]|nr:ribosome biogenesis GTPase Der [Nitrospinota bacterium]MCG2709100.1 ribosome biogenesis GTPase Der [Thermodesulfovibrionales bacterium]